MSRRVTLLLTVGGWLLVDQPVAAAEPNRFDPAAIDGLVADALQQWGVPGVSVVVVGGGQTMHLKGYGTKRTGGADPVTADTVFPLASCTKAFTSALLAAMADDGTLGWDDPVRKRLPNFRLSDPHADAMVTVRDLVTHRSGYAGTEHDYLWYRAPWGIDEVLQRASKLPPSGPFRGEYRYSSILFMAAGRAAANRASRPWDDLVRDRLCTPLGMSGVAFTSADAARAADRATGHRRGKGEAVEVMPAYEMTEPNPSGSMFATGRDLAAWLKFQLAGGVTDGGKRLVSAANLAETKTPHTVMRKDETVGPVYPDSVQVSYAMGWVNYDHRGKRVVAHGGVIDGFRAQVTLLPDENIGFALLNNLHQTRMNIALGNALIDHLLRLPPKDWHGYFLRLERDEQSARSAALERRNRERRPGTRPSAPLAAYAGEYEDAAYGTGTVTVRDGRLAWEWGNFRCPLEHFQDDTFRISDGFFEDRLVEFQVLDGTPVAVRATGGVVFRRK